MTELRKIKFKTLDNKLTDMTVQKDISIPDLKLMVKDKLGVLPELQRMIFKGKQLKDDKTLSDYVTVDEEIIHLMAKTVQSSDPQNEPNRSTSTENPPQEGNPNPFGNILGNILNNPNTMMQMTSMFLGGEGGRDLGNLGGINLNSLIGGLTNNSQGGQGINLDSLLQNLTNHNVPNTQSSNNVNETPNVVSDRIRQYPMLSKPEEEIGKLLRALNASEEAQSPGLSYPLNVLTAIGRTVEEYSKGLTLLAPKLRLLSDLLQKESLVTDPEERQKVKDLIIKVTAMLSSNAEISAPLSKILSSLDYGRAPGTGIYTQLEAAISVSEVPIVVNDTRNTNQGDVFGNLLRGMSQPENMQMMMGMVNNLLGGGQTGNANPLNNLISSLTGTNSPPRNEIEYFEGLNNQNSRRTTIIGDIPANFLKLTPEPDFAQLVEKVVKLMTVEEVVGLKSINLGGFTRLRRNIRSLIVQIMEQNYNSNEENMISAFSDTILERIRLNENETHKIISESLDLNRHIRTLVSTVIHVLLDTGLSDMRFSSHLKFKLLESLKGLFEDLKRCYSTGEDGAIYFFDLNLEDLLNSVLGKSAVDKIFWLDETFIDILVDNLLTSFNELQTEVRNDNTNENQRIEVDLTADQIIDMAKKDSLRLGSVTSPQFSQDYINTSLFK